MRVLASLAAALMLAVLALTGCDGGGGNVRNGTTAQKGNAGAVNAPKGAATPSDNVRRMTITELRDALQQGKAVVVDVRSVEAYNQEHIQGALLIPENQIASRAGELPKDKLIVLYCS